MATVLVIGAQGVLAGIIADVLRDRSEHRVLVGGRRHESRNGFRLVDLADPATICAALDGVDFRSARSPTRNSNSNAPRSKPARAPSMFPARSCGRVGTVRSRETDSRSFMRGSLRSDSRRWLLSICLRAIRTPRELFVNGKRSPERVTKRTGAPMGRSLGARQQCLAARGRTRGRLLDDRAVQPRFSRRTG